MKESDKNELEPNPSEPQNNKRKSILRDTMYLKASLYDNKIPFQNKTAYKKRESTAAFERILNNKLKLEEKEQALKMEIKQKKKLVNKINSSIRKDYMLFFFLFLSSSFNFNYFFLLYIFLGTIYLSCLGNFNSKPKKLKYFFEIFIIGYTSYLLLFKIIIYSLIRNENKDIVINKKDLFIDLGNCILKDRDSYFYFIMNFLPEVLIILSSGYGILISFRTRLITPNDLKVKNITNFKLNKYVLFIYVLMICCTMFNLSFLSLFYIICIQIILFLCSIKFREKIIKKILKYMIYLITMLSSLQIIFTNVLNIPSINKKLFNNSEKSENKKYLISRQIGLNINNESEDTQEIVIHFIGYFFSIIALLILINTKSKLSIGSIKEENNEEINENDKNEDDKNSNQVDKFVFKKSIFYKIIDKIMKFIYHPIFNFEISRIISITWTYFYRNIFSLGILIFIFISFLSPHIKRNKYLVIFILSPMVLLSLCAFHISNITGMFKNLSQKEESGYSRLGLKKYDYEYIEYPLDHLFFIIIMFLINSLYTAEALQIEEEENNEEEKPQIMEMQFLGSSNRLEESILSKDDKEEINLRVNKSLNLSVNTTINDNESENSNDNIIINKSIMSSKINRSTNDINVDVKRRSKKNVSIKRTSTKYVFDITFVSLIKKLLLQHIDKITLIVLYFVSVYTINAIHAILVLILFFQIVAPNKLNYFYRFNIIFFQLLYVIEFIIDLLKSKYTELFKENKNLLKFLISYNEDLNSNDLEIFIYGVIYCFYFQYRTCNIESNKELLSNKKLSLSEYIKIKFKNHPTIQAIFFGLGNILSHLYLWFLMFIFIFFTGYYEINFIFGIKLIIFLLCCLQFIFLFQATSISYSDIRCFKIINRFFLIFCCLNTLSVYIYQFLCKDLLSIKELIYKKREEDNFFMKNLPNFGFTIYKEDNLYINFLPHFLSTFIAVLFLSQSEKILDDIISNQSHRRFTMSHLAKEKLKKKKDEQDRMNRIKNELNEFIQDKMYADKYTENYNEIKAKSNVLFRIRLILLFTKIYWLGLFLSGGIIFNKHDMSFFMLLYALIFGIFSMKKFHRIISKLTNYIKNKSYYVSKVIRYSIVEKPKNIELNRKYRIAVFKCLIILSFIYLILIYFYGILDRYQHGCNPDLFTGCEQSFSQIFSSDNESDEHHESTEAKIKSFALLFGFYFNTRKENILKVTYALLILTFLIIFDLYNQKLELYYSDKKETLKTEIQELVNENNILQKYADIADLNILIKIGLAVEGIDLSNNNNMDSPSKVISLKDKFKKVNTLDLRASSVSSSNLNLSNNASGSDDSPDDDIKNNNDLEQEREDEDEPLQVDEPNPPVTENYDLNEKDPSNSFLKHRSLKKFLDIIKKWNENEQQLSVCNIGERVIQFVKRLIEQIIIFICLCLSLSKLNIWTFVYLVITIFLIFVKKTMYRFYLLYCFIFFGLTVQSIFFILNTNSKSYIKTSDSSIYNVTSQALNIPLYKHQFDLTEEKGFFFGLGVSQYQVNNIILEFIQIIVIYLYLNIFSYSIYQNILNLGESSVKDRKFDLSSLNLEEGSLEMIKATTEMEFLQYKECLSCYDFNIGENLDDFFELLKIDNTVIVNPLENNEKKIRLNLKEIKNPVLKELIKYRMLLKDLRDNLEKKETKKYKPLPKFLIAFQKILYLYFHCFLLILMIMISMMTSGVLSTVYFGTCFYYLLKSDSLYLGQEYTYPKAIKRTLRIIVLIDITIQGIYQLPFFSLKEDDIRFKILSALGFFKVVDINDNEISTFSRIDIYGKAIIYFFMSVQHYIYDSKYFKRYYLAFLLENKFKTNKTSLVNAFTFNNNRIKIYKKSLSIRQKSMEAMDDLKKIVKELNEKLNKVSEKIFSKNNNNENEEEEEENKKININNKETNIIENNLLNNETYLNNKFIEMNNAQKRKSIKENFLMKQKNKGKMELEPDEIKDRIKSMIYNRFFTKMYLWFHKNTANYKSVAKNAKLDFDVETIKGETKIKSIIETDMNRALSIVDLTGLDKNDMKEIKELIESHFDSQTKKNLEERKNKEKRSQTYIKKFQKFGSNLVKLNKFAKMMLSFQKKDDGAHNINNINNNNNNIENEKKDILEAFKLQSEKEKEEKLKKEKEQELKRKKIEHIEELFDTKLFKRYLRTGYLIEHILNHLQALFINNFSWVCYFFMILAHMMSSSIITLIYPLSIFCYALLEYPRPKKAYWISCLIYTMIIMFIKFILQLKLIHLFISEETYADMINSLYNNRIGFQYFKSMFSRNFISYIIFDILIVFTIAINRNLLMSEGLWFKREDELENIYQASERVAIYKYKKHANTIEAVKDLLFKYFYTPKEIVNRKKHLGISKENTENIRHKFPFFEERKLKPEFDEAKKSYFKRIFPTIRNEKPGKDFHVAYSIIMFLICIYILFFYTKMDQDKTYGPVDLDTTQFSGRMVLYLILHIAIITYDRIIFVMQDRDNLKYEYYFYKRNAKNGQGELINEKELNLLKSEICKNDASSRFDNISWKEIDILQKDYNILFIQKETFNKTLLNKYILHIITTLVCHGMVFFYFPIKGNLNLGNEQYCQEGENNCNDFLENNYIIIFYIIYLFYLLLSGLQVKYGFYDIKRKSLFKKKDDEIFSNMGSLFRLIPFLNEIKNALDWACTNTCLTLFQWNKFEAIYDTIFDTYCEKSDWDEKLIGEKVSLKKKLSMGGSLAFILILILVTPLILFSSLNPTNKLNNITAAKISVDLTFNYENGAIKNYNLFENTRADSISDMTENIWSKYNYSKSVQTRNFNKKQVQRIIFSETSDRNWDLARPHIKSLIQLLDISKESDISSVVINIGYELTRPLPAEAQTCSDTFSAPIYSKGDNLNISKGAIFLNELRSALANCSDINITIDQAYSPPLRLTSAIDVNRIVDKRYFLDKDVELGFGGCYIENNITNYINSYFSVKSLENGIPHPLELHIFSDQISETTSGYSVLTFYISFVLLAGSYIREFLANEPEKIMLEEMPHPKRIVDLCEGIKIARYSNDFKNEEYLYTILIELMRSPDYLKIITDSSLDHFKLREELTEKMKNM